MCEVNLRFVCIVVGAIGVAFNVGDLFIITGFLMAVMLAVSVVGSLALLFGAILEDERLVLVALIIKLLYLVLLAIAILGNLFTFKMWLILLHFVFQLIITYIVYAYYNELRGSEDD